MVNDKTLETADTVGSSEDSGRWSVVAKSRTDQTLDKLLREEMASLFLPYSYVGFAWAVLVLSLSQFEDG